MRAHYFQTQGDLPSCRSSYMKNMIIYLFVTQKITLVQTLDTGQEMNKIFISL